MSRYENTRIEYDKEKNVMKKNTTIYKNVPEENGDIYVITQIGDRLDTIADQFYNDPSLWWFIASTNNLNKMNISPGTRLRISMNMNNAKDNLDKSNP